MWLMKQCPHCGKDLEQWFVQKAQVPVYNLDGTIRHEEATIAIRKSDEVPTQAELEARNLD